ncbi:MAG: TM2 domain-containing protein [Marinifilaceae bacterium]
MKKLLILLFIVAFAAVNNVSAANYKLDNAKIDVLFETAQDANTSLLAQSLNLDNSFAASKFSSAKSEKTFVAALLLDIFLGGFGVHRFYLGTEILTGVGYILTCGGIFGIIPLIDMIVLIVDNDDISKYVDNSKFFMWSK